MLKQIRLVASEDRYIFFLLMYYAKNYYSIIENIIIISGIGVLVEIFYHWISLKKRCSGAEASELVKRIS